MTVKKEPSAKKTFKKEKVSSTVKAKLTDFEKSSIENIEETKICEFELNEKKYSISVKNSIDLDSRETIVNSVETIYFRDGVYDKVRGDILMEQLIFYVYTGLAFANDLNYFSKFKNTEIYLSLKKELPREVDDLWADIYDRIEFFKPKYNAPLEESKFFATCSGTVAVVSQLLEKISFMIEENYDSLFSGSTMKIDDIVDAMKSISKRDETKIVNAILEHQTKKKEAELETRESAVAVE